MTDALTPIWCSYCECYVPLEREPHVSVRDPERGFHYASDQDREGPSLPNPAEPAL